MGEVIEFKKKENITVDSYNTDDFVYVDDFYPEELELTPIQEYDQFLSEVKKFLSEEDYKSVLCGILDKEMYDELPEKLQDIVDEYFMTC